MKLAIAIAVFALALSAQAQVAMPNPELTPGVVLPLTAAQVCSTKWGADRRHVTDKMKLEVCLAYGKTPADCFARDLNPEPTPKHKTHPRYEFDHREPREGAGADDKRNVWPQPWAEARLKDRLENLLHKKVCATPQQMTLEEEQAVFFGDWWAAYKKYFPTPAPRRKKTQPAQNPLADRMYFEQARAGRTGSGGNE